jgi:hypothetical protein
MGTKQVKMSKTEILGVYRQFSRNNDQMNVRCSRQSTEKMQLAGGKSALFALIMGCVDRKK